ncbi:DtxR family iron (metal) dependent repressor [Pedobacter psychrotolerans]|uniref:Transcriptional regulator MntR n=1 Tax=Pedobacter psychrotolerans TaxID=1843235 RepID=A0A4V2RZC5_9SPHI|nr:metal-dependent transcriptional regulator [Pedobacter psychrotolerans]TCO25175.1 DtxR family iron (metal) dependent repressor [Pedobacter psychrotolerans]GGE47518.1 iron-dependent repressor [Pedobacter psychrotolerans]
MQSFTEENYLKIIYHLAENTGNVQTNAIAEQMQTKPASVTDMIKKLAEKGFVDYIKYQGVTLTEKGRNAAIEIVRKHRLWEVFLVDKLNFKWDEVHDVAEELEHIKSTALIERLDEFLGFPKSDPHGDPIPDKNGRFAKTQFTKLIDLKIGDQGTITGVSQHSSAFLKHLEKLGLTLGKQIEINDVTDFDGSVEILIAGKQINISREVAKHILTSSNGKN